MRPPTLSSFQLKERGWTPAMIRDLLGSHDRERKSELRVGSRDRLMDGIVKLYLEERVVQAETTEAFAVAQDRARIRQDAAAKAIQTRQANHAEQVTQHAAVPVPMLQRHPEESQLTGQQLWKHHQLDLFRWQRQYDHLLDGLPRALRREAESRAYERYREVFHTLYGDRPWHQH